MERRQTGKFRIDTAAPLDVRHALRALDTRPSYESKCIQKRIVSKAKRVQSEACQKQSASKAKRVKSETCQKQNVSKAKHVK